MSIIDSYCKLTGNVLESCTLNQTDCSANKNKFYIMQLIETKNLSSATYNIFIRYGRIGESGKSTVEPMNDKNSATKYFQTLYKKKTGNVLGTPFVKKADKYFLSEMEKPKEEKEESDSDKSNDVVDLDDKLDSRLAYLLDLISNVKMLNASLVKLNIDSVKMPLGKISSTQLNKAMAILGQIKLLIEKNDSGPDSGSDSGSDSESNSGSDSESDSGDNKTKLTNLSSEYYTLVPYNNGRKKLPLIETSEQVDKNIELLEELKNIHITYSIIKNAKTVNKLTNVYDQLKTKISPLAKDCKMYSELLKYVENTHCPTHKYKLDVVDIFETDKDSYSKNDKFTKNMGNKTLLFHGSPIGNWCSILSNGLLLDPSKLGVKISGKMFGYGIYWANAITKSFNYCGSESTNNTAVLAIGEVTLGDMYEQIQSNYNLSQVHLDSVSKNSTWGKGQYTPSQNTKIGNVIIPNGKLEKKNGGNSLLYDEFIIYNSNQYKIKYLIVVKLQK